MKKSNSKTLYRFTKELKQKQNLHEAPQDSFDVPSSLNMPSSLNKKKNSHNRTQSCPFAEHASPAPKTTIIHQKPVSQYSWNTASKLQKYFLTAKSISQSSMGGRTVIVRDVGLEQMSSLLWRGGKKTIVKKANVNWKGIFSKNQVAQQIRTYQLREQLKQIQKKNQQAALKQRILQSLLSSCEGIADKSFVFA